MFYPQRLVCVHAAYIVCTTNPRLPRKKSCIYEPLVNMTQWEYIHMYIIMDMRCDGQVNVCMSTQDGEEDDDLKNEDLDPQNPREYLQKAAANMDDEYSNKKGSGSMQNYYGIAHTLREPVNEQPSLIVNGRLKQYQVRHFPLLSSLHIYTRTYIHTY